MAKKRRVFEQGHRRKLMVVRISRAA